MTGGNSGIGEALAEAQGGDAGYGDGPFPDVD